MLETVQIFEQGLAKLGVKTLQTQQQYNNDALLILTRALVHRFSTHATAFVLYYWLLQDVHEPHPVSATVSNPAS